MQETPVIDSRSDLVKPFLKREEKSAPARTRSASRRGDRYPISPPIKQGTRELPREFPLYLLLTV